MANKKISELQSRTPALSDLMLVGDPSSGYSYKCTVTALATIIETDIADGYVTIGTTQTISGAKTFSNNLTLTSVVNTPTDPDKFLTLNASNVVTYRTGAEVLSDIGGVGGSGTTNYLPKFSATTTLANSQIFDNGTNIGIATATPDATARVQINKTDGYGLYLNYNTSTGSGVSTTALYAINTTASSGYAAVIEEKTPNTTAGQYPFVIKHSLSSGTAGVGFGTGVHFQLLDDAGTSKTTQLTIENIDAAAATYKTRYRFNVQNNGSSTPVVYINGTGLGVFTASPSVALDVTGEGKFSTINNATTDTDKFLVSDSGVLKYRTGAEVLSDIGGQGALTLTTSGSSGAATLVGNTLNIPNYGSALSGYVPYTGATTNVNLGTRYLQANYLVVDGQSNATGINFKQYSSVSFNGDGYTAMGPVSVDKMFFNFAQGSNIFKIFYFDVSGITGNATRAYTMPNSDGTLALTSQIPTVSGTTNYIPKFTSSSAIGNSIMSEGSGAITVGGNIQTDGAANRYLKSTGFISNQLGQVSDFGANDAGYFVVAGGGLAFVGAGSERMRLDASGNLLVGASSGDGKLYIQTSTAVAYSSIDYNGTNANLRLKSGGSPTTNTTAGISFGVGGSAEIYIGAVQQANTYANLVFQTFGPGAVYSTKMTLDASGNLGLGVTPSAWDATYKAFQFGNSSTAVSALFSNGANNFWSVSNAYFDGTSFKYITTGTATGYEQVNGSHKWYQVASGSGGASISFTQAMTLDASGNLNIGTTGGTRKLNVYSATSGTYATYISQQASTSNSYGLLVDAGTNSSDATMRIRSKGGTDYFYIRGDGNVGIGTTSPSTPLNVVSAYSAGTTTTSLKLATVGGYNTGSGTSLDFGQDQGTYSTWLTGRISSPRTGDNWGGSLVFFTNDNSSATAIQERMRITSSGNVGIGTTSPTGKLHTVLPAYTSEDTDSQQAIFGSGTSGYGVRIGYNESTNAGYINSLKPSVAWSNLYIQANNLVFGTVGNERMRIASDGNVGIGGNVGAPDAKLTISNNSAEGIEFAVALSSNLNRILSYNRNTSVYNTLRFDGLDNQFYTQGIEKMRLTSSGELLINTTSDAGDYKLQVNGNVYQTGNLHISKTDAAANLQIRMQQANRQYWDFLTDQNESLTLKPQNSTTGEVPAFRVQNSSGTNQFSINTNTSAAEFAGTIKTAAPSGGTAASWKLGERVASSGLTLNDTQYIQLDIAGTLYTLATVNLP